MGDGGPVEGRRGGVVQATQQTTRVAVVLGLEGPPGVAGQVLDDEGAQGGLGGVQAWGLVGELGHPLPVGGLNLRQTPTAGLIESDEVRVCSGTQPPPGKGAPTRLSARPTHLDT